MISPLTKAAIAQQFGSFGAKSIELAAARLESAGAKVIAEGGINNLTIKSSTLDLLTLREILKAKTPKDYQGWEPHLEQTTDGSTKLRLKPITKEPQPIYKSKETGEIGRLENRAFNELNALNFYPKGKVLDVGARTGEFTMAFRTRGASQVIALDPDKNALSKGLEYGFLKTNEVLNIPLQELPTNLQGSFDHAVVLLWNIGYAEQEDFTKSLAKSINPKGRVTIGVHDEFYINDPQQAIRPLLQRYFGLIQPTTHQSALNQYIFTCFYPKASL